MHISGKYRYVLLQIKNVNHMMLWQIFHQILQRIKSLIGTKLSQIYEKKTGKQRTWTIYKRSKNGQVHKNVFKLWFH